MRLKNKFIRLDKNQRLSQCSRPIIAITGGIATGKSTVSQLLRQQHFSIICADTLIKQIYQTPTTIQFLQENIPEVLNEHSIDFLHLRKLFFNNSTLRLQIENILFSQYPQYLKQAFENETQSFILYDIPLLFEKRLQDYVDQTICVHSSPSTQIKRIIHRDKCSLDVAKKILKAQIPINQKAKLADYVINNETSLDDLHNKVTTFTKEFFTDS